METSPTPSNMKMLAFIIRPSGARRGDPMCATIERPLRSFVPLLWVVIFAGAYAHAQNQTDPELKEGSADLSAKIEVMTHSIEQMQSELTQSRQEIQQLRDMLAQLLRAQGSGLNANPVDEHATSRP